MSLNHIDLMGRMVASPELRHTQSGVAVASFTLAVERDFAEGGNKQTDFIDIVAWRQTGEFAAKYFAKGQLVAVSGRLQLRDWTNNEGKKQKAAEVIADSVYFAEGKKSNNTEPDTKYSQSSKTDTDFTEVDDSGELPF